MSRAGLSAKQEAFCVEYVKSGNASAAYRGAGYSNGASEKSVNESASRLLKSVKIQSRLSELRLAIGEASQVTLQSHLADLLWLREMAAKSGKYAAAVQAEMARGKVAGLYIERITMSGGLDIVEKVDLTALSIDELRVMHMMMEKAGATGQALH